MNYTIYHLHSQHSNPTVTTRADSITKFTDYLDYAQELGMSSIAFSEHGSILNWMKKKEETEKRGLKYIHANEIYLTEKIDNENGLVRDNFHYMLIAKNFEGVKELNALTSNSYKKDGHFYYNPRVTFDELKSTSDNIIMTSACLASPLWNFYKKGEKNKLEDLLNWMVTQRHRMFFEIQPHNHPEQIQFNQLLMRLSQDLNIPLIAGTDTHALNKTHMEARSIYMKSKGVNFSDEDTFDLTMHSYEKLVEKFKEQNAMPKHLYLEAIENTNVMANMVEEFTIDKSHKYPRIYENPIETFKEKINKGSLERGIQNKENKKEYFSRIKDEFEVYKKLDSIDYMLLMSKIVEFCREKGIEFGYGRGSVTGSLIAYLLGIHEMDSIKHSLIFSRFMNADRISLADIDSDYPPTYRQDVIDYVANNIKGVNFAEIVTFNTKAMKGCIRLVAKALDIPLSEADTIAKAVTEFGGKQRIDDSYREKYRELFKYVDILDGIIESVGSHPSGFVVAPSDINLDEHVGTFYTDKSKYPVTCLNMKEIDAQNFVKLDILGLDNIEVINETCKLAGIERLTPDNMDTTDIDVWKSLTESTISVFQMESQSAQAYLKKLFSDETLEKIKTEVGEDIDYIELLSMANGAIRPSGASYRDDLASGVFDSNGHYALDDMLKSTLGKIIFQEQIMEFLVKFCGYTGSQSDTVRRGLAKKSGTEQYLQEIEVGFIKTMKEKYGEEEEHAKQIIKSFLQVVKDASGYGFSTNHSKPYSYTGYACAWLRHYYPLEFLTTLLNTKDDISSDVFAYIKNKGYKIKNVKFGRSRSKYFLSKDESEIYKGVTSIKGLNEKASEELYALYHTLKGVKENKYSHNDWINLLCEIEMQTSVNKGQMITLIMLDYFSDYGQKHILLDIFMKKNDEKVDTKKYPNFGDSIERIEKINKKTKSIIVKEKKVSKPLNFKVAKLSEKTVAVRMANLEEYYNEIINNQPNVITMQEQIKFEIEKLDYVVSVYNDVSNSVVFIIDVDLKYTPKLTLLQVSTGKQTVVKMSKNDYYSANINKFDVLNIKSFGQKRKKRPIKDGEKIVEWQETDEIEFFINDFEKIEKL